MPIEAVKYSLGETKRRVSGKVEYEQLCELVHAAFDSTELAGGFTFQYLDNENEVITFSSNAELQEAYQVAEENGQKSLQVRVVPNSQSMGEWVEDEEADLISEGEDEISVQQEEQQQEEGSVKSEPIDSADEFEMVETASKFSSDEPLAPGSGDFDVQSSSDNEEYNEQGFENAEIALVEEEHEMVDEQQLSVHGSESSTDQDEPALDQVEESDEPEVQEEESNKLEVQEEESNELEVQGEESNELEVQEDESNEFDVQEDESNESEVDDNPESEEEEDENLNQVSTERNEEFLEEEDDHEEQADDMVDEPKIDRQIVEENGQRDAINPEDDLPAELIQALIDLETSDSQNEESPKDCPSEEQTSNEANSPSDNHSDDDTPPEPFEWPNNFSPIAEFVNHMSEVVAVARSKVDEEAAKSGHPNTGEMAESIGKVFNFVKNAVETTTKPAPKTESTKTTNDNKSGEQPSLFATLPSLLAKPEVVQQIQRALAEQEITDLVVALAEKYKDGDQPKPEEFMTEIMSRLCSLLPWFHRLASSIPELVFTAPQLASYIISFLKDLCTKKSISSKCCGKSCCCCSTNKTASCCGKSCCCCGTKSDCCSGKSKAFNNGPFKSVRSNQLRNVHFSVFCDGCRADAAKLTLSKERNCYDTTNGYIVGVRYKSAIAEDFDLCASCESSNEFTNKEPFLKINNPSQAPTGIMCVLPGNEERGPRSGCRQSRGPRCMRQGLARHVRQHQQANGAVPVRTFVDRTVDVQDLEKASYVDMVKSSVPVAKEASQVLQCPRQHELNKHVTSDLRYICDKCQKRIGRAQEVFGCRTCDYDVCSPCVAKMKKSERMSAPEAKPTPSTAEQSQTPQPWHANSNPQAKFISITSLPDGSVVNPGQVAIKGWQVLNSGNTSWPAGSRMVCVGGDRMGGPHDGVKLPAAAPGTTVHIQLPLRAPTRPGRYVGYWRFITTENHRFGHRFWVDLSVRGSAHQQVVSSVMAPINTALDSVWKSPTAAGSATVSHVANQPSVAESDTMKQELGSLRRRYSEELTQLANMGFCDLDKNAVLLKKHNGQIDVVLGKLVDQQDGEEQPDQSFWRVVDRL